jgi:hypothetical protein
MNTNDDTSTFTDFLAELGHGAINKQAGDRMRSLVRSCVEHGGKGKFVLTVDVKASGLVEIKASLKTTEPQPGGVSATYFATATGDLVTEDPAQLSMPAKMLKPTPIRGGQS